MCFLSVAVGLPIFGVLPHRSAGPPRRTVAQKEDPYGAATSAKPCLSDNTLITSFLSETVSAGPSAARFIVGRSMP
jgi:hypothetical protein